jgi:hypothetical protein
VSVVRFRPWPPSDQEVSWGGTALTVQYRRSRLISPWFPAVDLLSGPRIIVREALRRDIVGSIQFYGRFIYQLILVEGDVLAPEAEVAYRFTPGTEPMPGEKRPKTDLP